MAKRMTTGFVLLLAAVGSFGVAGNGATAQADVCVSIHGDVKVDEGDSDCYADATSRAVAVNDSYAQATHGGRATAINNCLAIVFGDARATRTNCQ